MENLQVFRSYRTKIFDCNNRQSLIVFPEKVHPKNYWVWRARFFGIEPQVDIALLEKGFHVVYTDVTDWFGAPVAVQHWNLFYDYVTSHYGLNPKVVLEGFSRGGLIVYNWASKNTEKVACIYADAPVCDINSWPGGTSVREEFAMEWGKCLKAYGLTEEQTKNHTDIPVYNCKEIAKAKIPVLHVCGDEDVIVPMSENTAVVERNIKKAGGTIEVIIKKGIGHHPHCLENPEPIVRFILQAVATRSC